MSRHVFRLFGLLGSYVLEVFLGYGGLVIGVLYVLFRILGVVVQ